MRFPLATFPWMLPALLAAGCGADTYERQADRAVENILNEGAGRTLGGREETVLHPVVKPAVVKPPEPAPQSRAPELGPPTPVQVLSLSDSLDIAIQSNRDHISRKESLYLTALSLTSTRHTFAPNVAAALTYLFTGSDTGPEVHAPGLVMSVSKLLPTGGRVSAEGLAAYTNSGDDSFSSSANIRLTQPFLRGAGREVAYEALTQAERSLIYAIRDFELYREAFSIDVATRFYGLVQQKQSVQNQRRNLEGFVFGTKQAEALYSVGRTSELEVLRARRSELTSQNSLIEAEESYHLALDQFRIFLGLPESHRIEVASEEPTFVEVNWDVQSAVDVAIANRLDLLNRKEQLEDAQRGVRIAKNGLLPDLNFEAGYTRTGDAGASFVTQDLNDSFYSTSLTLGLPIDRLNERNAYRSSQFALAQSLRSYSEFRDELEVGVQSTFRELERRKKSLEIQTQLIADQVRNVKIAQLRFEQGNFSNRDVVEAQQALLDAQNALISEKVDYEIARLRLLKDLGILFIDEKGMWKE